jgi:Flp pilus assembly protein TadG
MRPRNRGKARHRRGNILAIAVVLMPVILGFAATTADLGVIALARSQLMTVADSAALAGAQQLATNNRLVSGYVPTTEMAAARIRAETIGQANTVLNAAAVVKDGDVVITEFDQNPRTLKWAVAASPVSSNYNSVTVTAQRSSDHGGLVPAFFSKVWGSSGTTVTFTSTATAQNYSISGYTSGPNLNAQLLPLVLDLNTYNAMISGTTQDSYRYVASTDTVTQGSSDGIHESVLFPVGSGSPGNWGLLYIGSSRGASTISDQILNGIPPDQLNALQIPPSPGTLTVSGDSGMKASVGKAFGQIVGQTRSIAIYDPAYGTGGGGANATYTIVKYAAITVLDSNFSGNPKYVIVQPALSYDPTAIPGTPQAWTSGGVVGLHLSQ